MSLAGDVHRGEIVCLHLQDREDGYRTDFLLIFGAQQKTFSNFKKWLMTSKHVIFTERLLFIEQATTKCTYLFIHTVVLE